MVTYWPHITGEPEKYIGYRWFQKEKHGTTSLIEGDFLDTTLQLGKSYITKIEEFLEEEGYNQGGIFNCKNFQDKLNSRFACKVTAVFGWDGGPKPAVIQLKKLRYGSIKLGEHMPARVERTERKEELQLVGEATGECYDVVMFFGIIDILQDYDITKKLESASISI
ncbi:hypothetical protein POM88_038321 [Heracleum sosnowskyi]|uniref:1-phosphatidylinositol-4-phosphate 5-kinase n=1 Tax=Heracleum sosnowskyi TaxID=360622 RepID=A0AAD8M5D3_9APIA|nr:hypothetical protein POM88_038321 [Heracleum sosnowskyi]